MLGDTARIEILSAGPGTVVQDGILTVTIRVTNNGSQDWTPTNEVACPDIYPIGQPTGCAPHPEAGKYTVYAEVRPAGLINQNYNGGAFAFPPIVHAGEAVELTGSFRIHLPPGNYMFIPETALAGSYGFGPNGTTSDATDQWNVFPHFPFQVVEADPTPPTLTFSGRLASSSCVLWPPNGQMVTIGEIGASDAESGIASLTVTVTSDDNTITASDSNILNVGPFLKSVSLRARRSGQTEGRTYIITVSAANTQGAVRSTTKTCSVPHDQGKK